VSRVSALNRRYYTDILLRCDVHGQVRGLCGNMDGSMSNDWTSRRGIEEKLLSMFAMSYGVCVGTETNGLSHNVGLVVDTCSAADSAVVCLLVLIDVIPHFYHF